MRIGYCTVCDAVQYDKFKRNYREFVIITNYGTHLLSCCKGCFDKLDKEKAEKAFNDDLEYQIEQIKKQIDLSEERKVEEVKKLRTRVYKYWVYKL